MGAIITSVNDGICFECNENYINQTNQDEGTSVLMEFKKKALFVSSLFNWKILTDIHCHNNDRPNSKISHNSVVCGEK